MADLVAGGEAEFSSTARAASTAPRRSASQDGAQKRSNADVQLPRTSGHLIDPVPGLLGKQGPTASCGRRMKAISCSRWWQPRVGHTPSTMYLHVGGGNDRSSGLAADVRQEGD